MNFTSVNLIKKFQNRTGKLAQVVEDLPSPEFKPSTATPKFKKKKPRSDAVVVTEIMLPL
jgi:hypothetical protein